MHEVSYTMKPNPSIKWTAHGKRLATRMKLAELVMLNADFAHQPGRVDRVPCVWCICPELGVTFAM